MSLALLENDKPGVGKSTRRNGKLCCPVQLPSLHAHSLHLEGRGPLLGTKPEALHMLEEHSAN